MKHISFEGKIWNSAVDAKSMKMYFLVRTDSNETFIAQVDPESMEHTSQTVNLTRWTQLIGAVEDVLYFIAYQDEHDPNQNNIFCIRWGDDKNESVEQLPDFSNLVTYPSIYEHGSDYHQTVQEFLSVELPHSCEYLEWKDKIIISYYLRSGNVFDRHLLLLKDGAKELKVCQDREMKGFSPGAFFVFNEQLIFIKDQHEVCVYPG